MSEQPPEDVPPSPAPPAPPAYPTYGTQYPPQPYQQPYAQPYQQPYAQPGYGYPPYGYPTPGAVDKRPGTVTAALVITWVLTGLALIGALIVFVVAAADNHEAFRDLMEDDSFNSYTYDQVRQGFLIGAIVFIVWCVAVLVVSAFAFRRHNWARITLVVSAVVATIVELVAILAVFPLFFAMATIAVIVLLFSGGANQWYRSGPAKDGGLPQAPPGVTFYQ